MRKRVLILAIVPAILLFGLPTALAGPIAPTPVPSELTVEVEPAGIMPKAPGANIASPQPYGPNELFLISHVPTEVFSLDTRAGEITQIYDPSQTPAGITPTSIFALMNVAGDAAKNKVYMVLTSRTLPPGIPTLDLPDPDTDPSGGREDFLFIDTFDPANGFGNGNAGSAGETNGGSHDNPTGSNAPAGSSPGPGGSGSANGNGNSDRSADHGGSGGSSNGGGHSDGGGGGGDDGNGGGKNH